MRAIELISFGVATAADVGQLMAGASPLTANYVQWLTLSRRIAAEAQARFESISDVSTGAGACSPPISLLFVPEPDLGPGG